MPKEPHIPEFLDKYFSVLLGSIILRIDHIELVVCR